MKQKYILLAALMMACLCGCEKGDPDHTGYKDALVVKTVQTSIPTRSDNGMTSGNSTLVFPIRSVFVGGGVANPSKGSSHRCHFYTEKFTEGPNWDQVDALVTILGFQYRNVEYTKPGEYITHIYIVLPEEVPGLGTSITIPMEGGQYKGGNDLIRDVQIKSYKFSSYTKSDDPDGYTLNKDADIDIVITTTSGGTISLLFNNDVTPFDGYY
ncbi:MAG: hypothetical protein IKR44_03985 [Bacteroidales bacterium]|nr:hypothetical protein [Bacteroidales bacterium]